MAQKELSQEAKAVVNAILEFAGIWKQTFTENIKRNGVPLILRYEGVRHDN